VMHGGMAVVPQCQITEANLCAHDWLSAHHTAVHSTAAAIAASAWRSSADIRNSEGATRATG
jgi:hypothetical protein